MEEKLKKHKGLTGWLATGAACFLILAVSSFAVPSIFADTGDDEMQVVNTDVIEEPVELTASAIAVAPGIVPDIPDEAGMIWHRVDMPSDSENGQSITISTESDPGTISSEKAIQLARESLKADGAVDRALVDSLPATANYIVLQGVPSLSIDNSYWFVEFEYPIGSLDTLNVYLNAFTGKRVDGIGSDEGKIYKEAPPQ